MSGHEVRGEFTNKSKEGRLIDVEVSANAILDEKKNIIGFLGIQRDITERKRVEKELVIAKEKAERLNKLKECIHCQYFSRDKNSAEWYPGDDRVD